MRRRSFGLPAVVAIATSALAFVACSDTISGPRSLASSDAASFSVANGTNSFSIVSDGSTQLCTANGANGDYTIPSSFGPFTGCGTALNLTASLNTYNPGWSQPFTGSSWIGFTAKDGPSSDYRANPGRYVYQETFTIPANVTAPSLDMNVKADNVVAVYLNGKLLAQQANTDCNPGLTCNWNQALHVTDNTAGDFHINAANTLTFLVIDLPTGAFSADAGVGGTAPQFGCTTRFPQENGTAGFSSTTVPTVPNHVVSGGGTGVAITNLGAANQAGCENPTGLDFAATVSWTPAPPAQLCDFITFGRLTFDVGGQKVVISGNAGGNAPDGGILGEIQISIGGTDYHVKTIDSYGPTTNAPLFPDQFARVIKGMSGTHSVELRLRDDPNPGKGEPGTQEGDKVWLKIDGVVVVPTQTLDKGNIQLHLNCRGPKA
jgi:hypothetical protein